MKAMQRWISSVLAVVVFLTAIVAERAHTHQSSAYIGGSRSFFARFGKNHPFPHIIPMRKPISLPRHVPVLKHVSWPLPYPIFQQQQIPIYRTLPVKREQIVRVPVKIPKYYSVPVHKIVSIPRYVEVPVEVPIYQEVIVERPIEVSVPVYIGTPTRQVDVSPVENVQKQHHPTVKIGEPVQGLHHEPPVQAVDKVQNVQIMQ